MKLRMFPFLLHLKEVVVAVSSREKVLDLSKGFFFLVSIEMIVSLFGAYPSVMKCINKYPCITDI